jgi:predicted anti-sigma-YlaC factor YlaD
VIREISEYLNGNVDPGLVDELQHHLEKCEDCRIIVDTTKKTIDVYCNAEPAPLAEDVRERLHAALRKKLFSHPA